jgi:hypothetical protein
MDGSISPWVPPVRKVQQVRKVLPVRKGRKD